MKNDVKKYLINWKNRIIGSGEEDPEQLLANPYNWRIHPQKQKKALNEILSKIGWIQEIIINKRTNRLIDGHLRVQLAIENGEKKVPVKYVDLSEEEEKIVLTLYDTLTNMALADEDKLNELLDDVIQIDDNYKNLILSVHDDIDMIKIKNDYEYINNVSKTNELNTNYKIIIECIDQTEQQNIYKKLLEMGISGKIYLS